MPAVRTRLLGWTPSSSNESNVEVAPSQRSFPNFFSFKSSRYDRNVTESASLLIHDMSRCSTTRESTPDTPSTSLSTSSTTRSGSPDHVRRPRNSFIIFRCQYSREHSKSRSHDTTVDDTITDKSLSKRASEAWAKLSKEEKKIYEDMATLEKEEHARQNPDYRFSPKKRQPDSKRRKPRRIPSLIGLRRRSSTSGSSSQAQEQAKLERSSSGASLPPLSDLATSLPMPMLAQQHTRTPPPQLAAVPRIDPAVKAARRRSASAPQPFKPLAPPPMSNIYPMPERQEIQRSKSIVARPVILPHSRIHYSHHEYPSLGTVPRPIPPSFSSPELTFFCDATPLYSNSQPQSGIPSYMPSSEALYTPPGEIANPFSNPYDSTRALYVSPLTAVASSLSGWNGDFTAPSTPQGPVSNTLWSETCMPQNTHVVVQPQAPTYTIDKPSNGDETHVSYEGPSSAPLTPPYTDLYAEPDNSPQFVAPASLQPGSAVYQEAERSQALEEYGLGLSERLCSGSPIFGSQDFDGIDFNTSFEFDLNVLFPL